MSSSSSPVSPRWILPTYSRSRTRDGGWDEHGYAQIQLDMEHVLKYEKLIEQVDQVEGWSQEAHFEEMVLKVEQPPLRWHRLPGFIDDPDVEEAITMSRDNATAVEVDDRLELPTDSQTLHQPRLHMYDRYLEWSGRLNLRQDVEVKTGGLTRFDLARACLYMGSSDQVRSVFKRLAQMAPREALKVLESGIQPPLPLEGATPARSIVGMLSREDLMPLLRTDKPRYRERALTALTDVEQNTPAPEKSAKRR